VLKNDLASHILVVGLLVFNELYFNIIMLKIDYTKCCWKDGKCQQCSCQSGQCVGCVEACAVGALKRRTKVEVDLKKCIGCGACVLACKHGAIELI